MNIFFTLMLFFEAFKERLPDGPTNMYQCMDYRTITNKVSEQWQLQTECRTDDDTGIRYYEFDDDVYYCVAMGDAYGEVIGDTWAVTLKCGTTFNVIRSEFKDKYGVFNNFFGHPCKNYDEQDCTNVLEFVVDIDCVPHEAKIAGTMSKLDCFGGLYGDGGNIIKIEYTGRKWGA